MQIQARHPFSNDGGRVECKNRTLQDRLVKEMRLDAVTGMDAGNDWLPGYILRHNTQFARIPARPDNLHRAVTESPGPAARYPVLAR